MEESNRKELSVKNYYNNFSKNYDDMYRPIQFTKFYELKTKIDFEFDGWVLDHGGGTGLFSAWSNTELLTFDISIGMLRNGINKGYIAHAVACDIRYLPLRNSSITNIYSFTAIQNSSNPEKVLLEVKRIFDGIGLGVITILKKVYEESKYSPFFNLFDETEVINLEIEDIALVFHPNKSRSSSLSGSKSS